MNDICVCELCGYVWEDADNLEYDRMQDKYVCRRVQEPDCPVSPCQVHTYVDSDGEWDEEFDADSIEY
jgi:hypothetical protein